MSRKLGKLGSLGKGLWYYLYLFLAAFLFFVYSQSNRLWLVFGVFYSVALIIGLALRINEGWRKRDDDAEAVSVRRYEAIGALIGLSVGVLAFAIAIIRADYTFPWWK